MMLAARQRRWPAPKIYAETGEDGEDGQALARLERAITAGRHDAVLMPPPGDPSHLMRLLMHCTRHGVTVTFVAAQVPAPRAPVTPVTPAVAAAANDSRQAAHPPRPRESWDVLARARLEALAGLFPDWRVWLDRNGWHARRREGFLQGYRPGAPVFSVSADTATDLAAQLCWQQAADAHAPDGCHASIMAPPPWGGGHHAA
jgi:hypothetical protein